MRALVCGFVMMAAAAGAAAGDLAVIERQVTVGHSIERAWETWTTEEGLETFLARRCVVEPKPGGAFEILFFPDNPPGRRGAEGTFLLAVEHSVRAGPIDWDDVPPGLLFGGPPREAGGGS